MPSGQPSVLQHTQLCEARGGGSLDPAFLTSCLNDTLEGDHGHIEEAYLTGTRWGG